jgi:hypothetical protein
VEVRWDPRKLGKVLVYAEGGLLCEAFNLELANFHPTLEQLREYKRMKKLQRDVALAHLELMHMAADGFSGLHMTEANKRHRPKTASEAVNRNPVAPIFTSEAARTAWEAEQMGAK